MQVWVRVNGKAVQQGSHSNELTRCALMMVGWHNGCLVLAGFLVVWLAGWLERCMVACSDPRMIACWHVGMDECNESNCGF